MNNKQANSKIQLAPLMEKPSPEWVEKAKIALDFGFSPEEIVNASFAESPIAYWEGEEKQQLLKRGEEFSEIMECSDKRIKEISKLGVKKAHDRLAHLS